MAIVLSRDDKIVLHINSYPNDEFRKVFLNGVARRIEFTYALDDDHPNPEDLKTLRNLMIEAGVPEKLVRSDEQVCEAAQAVMNRIMESLH